MSELDEALEVADRILVMSDHAIVGEHRNDASLDRGRVFAEIARTPDHAARPAGAVAA